MQECPCEICMRNAQIVRKAHNFHTAQMHIWGEFQLDEGNQENRGVQKAP